MIKNRPKLLLADVDYCNRPSLPYVIDWSSIPDLIRYSTIDLGGVQPITISMAEAAGGTVADQPSEAEIELLRRSGTEFQMISVVASLVAIGKRNGNLLAAPFALSLLPASKRGKVQHTSIDAVAKLDISKIARDAGAFYTRFDPFTGEWGLYGLNTPELAAGPGFLDETGIVVDAFYLATTFDANEVLSPDIGLATKEANTRYAKHRRDLLFKPFEKIYARRVWGVDSPIELFLLQEFARRELYPHLQILITEDGSTFPSWYHLWSDLDFRKSGNLISEVDMFFPEEKIAVFCDGINFHRGKRKKKDEEINDRLLKLGITPIRLRGSLIVKNLGRAADIVEGALR